MMIAARSPAANPESSSAAASGSAASPNCRYVSRERSRSRSASIRQTSSGQRPSASRKAAPSESYFFKSSIKKATESLRHGEKYDYMSNSADESLYSVTKQPRIEVDEESDSFACDAQIRKYLRFKHRVKSLHAFDFDDNRIFHEQVDAILPYPPVLIEDWKDSL